MSVILYGGLVLLIAAGLIAGLDYLREGRELDRVQRLADADNAARVPVRREQAAIGDLVVHPEAEEWARRVCLRCRLGDRRQPCTCPDGDGYCGEDDCLAWANSISNAEEWER